MTFKETILNMLKPFGYELSWEDQEVEIWNDEGRFEVMIYKDKNICKVEVITGLRRGTEYGWQSVTLQCLSIYLLQRHAIRDSARVLMFDRLHGEVNEYGELLGGIADTRRKFSESESAWCESLYTLQDTRK